MANINSLRRVAAKKRREPNFITSLKLKLWREARVMEHNGRVPKAMLGVVEERMSLDWVNRKARP